MGFYILEFLSVDRSLKGKPRRACRKAVVIMGEEKGIANGTVGVGNYKGETNPCITILCG